MVTIIKPLYQRILLKLSGESLQGEKNFGIDINILHRIIKEVKMLLALNIQVGIVIGGGNIFRGTEIVKTGINRIVGDYMGMLATVINGLAMRDAFHRTYVKSYLMSAISLRGICSDYVWSKAITLLCNKHVVIFVAGTGNPLFTTDSAACLRGIEIKAEALLKGTKVDGVFSSDPVKNSNAVFFDKLSYQDVIKYKLNIMDLAAITMAKDYNLPIHVFNINKPAALQRIIMGDKEGTLISN